MFKRLRDTLKKREVHTRALMEVITQAVQEIIDQGKAHNDLVNLGIPVDDQGKFHFELNFFKKKLLRENEEMKKLFAKGWKKYVDNFILTASIPRVLEDTYDLLLLGTFSKHWTELKPEDIAKGIVEDAPTTFFETLQRASVAAQHQD